MEYDLASKINVVFLFKYRCFKNLLVLLNSMLGVSLYVCVGGGGIQSHFSWYKFWNKNGLMKLEILILTQTGVDSEQNFKFSASYKLGFNIWCTSLLAVCASPLFIIKASQWIRGKPRAIMYTTFLEFDLTVLDIIVRVHAGDICMYA